MTKIYGLIVSLVLCGCASQVPPQIRNAPPGNLMLSEAQSAPSRFTGTEVRWGGVITQVENKASQTWIEVVSRELKNNGQPREEGKSNGRFIASFQGFIDPVVYRTGDLLTVVGSIKGETTRPIGEYNYTFPIVAVTSSFLWQVEPIPARYEYPYPPPWYYDPWPFYHRPYPPYRW